MRILSWNVNSIRTVRDYYPWSELKSFNDHLDLLCSDIICFQEMKLARTGPDRELAVPTHYDAFFSAPASRNGYSGVAVYTDTRTAVPLRAEEGLAGYVQPKPPLAPNERVSAAYPAAHELPLLPDADGHRPTNLGALDSEGRGLVLDFGLFVLVNVYCPCETSGERLPFKMNYHHMLDARVRGLVAAGREVIVLGDMNICAAPIDHCDGQLPTVANAFYEHPARAWFRQWLDPAAGGCMVDVLRRRWPDRQEMYTCWDTKMGARETNYGTRIDYVLVTPGLLPWVKHGDIWAELKGSDHCPVYVELHEQITLASGAVVYLRDAMHMNGSPRTPPRIAARNWDDFSGKQRLMTAFLVQPLKPQPLSPAASSSSLSGDPSLSALSSSGESATPKETAAKKRFILTAATAGKRKAEPTPAPKYKKKQKHIPGQGTLTKIAQSAKSAKDKGKGKAPEASEVIEVSDDDTQMQVERDRRLAEQLSNDLAPAPAPKAAKPAAASSAAAWAKLLAPIRPPRCTVHRELARQFRSNKPGSNKGRLFYACARPVGPGYDKGNTQRVREEVNPTFKCQFFRWADEVGKF